MPTRKTAQEAGVASFEDGGPTRENTGPTRARATKASRGKQSTLMTSKPNAFSFKNKTKMMMATFACIQMSSLK